MSNIIRCRHCRTFVYDTASRCHGCGEAVRGGRLLGRGAYVFVALVTVAYGIGRGVDLIQTKSHRERAYAQSARDNHQARTFLEMFLRGQEDGYRQYLSPGSPEMATALRKLRDQLPAVLPVTGSIEIRRDRVVDVAVARLSDPKSKWERIRVETPVFGGRETGYEPPMPAYAVTVDGSEIDGPEAGSGDVEAVQAGVERGRAICLVAKAEIDRRSFNGTRLITVDGKNRSVYSYRWFEQAREFEYLVSNDARRFRIIAAVHLENGLVRTFRLGRIEDADTGEVILRESP